jgi:hypothetical protein
MARDSAPPPADEPDDLEAAQAAALTVDARAGDAELVTAIAAAMAHAGAVTKSSRNAEQNYSYASAESILEATRGPLLERGVLLIQRPRDWTVEEVRSRSGTVDVHYRAVARPGPGLRRQGLRQGLHQRRQDVHPRPMAPPHRRRPGGVPVG